MGCAQSSRYQFLTLATTRVSKKVPFLLPRPLFVHLFGIWVFVPEASQEKYFNFIWSILILFLLGFTHTPHMRAHTNFSTGTEIHLSCCRDSFVVGCLRLRCLVAKQMIRNIFTGFLLFSFSRCWAVDTWYKYQASHRPTEGQLSVVWTNEWARWTKRTD